MLPLKQQIIRIFFALFIGSMIGVERKYRGKPAGIRTHGIICVICTMLTIVSVYGLTSITDSQQSARLIANILTGVGFLAGGVIYSVNKGNRKNIHGLTTAAGVWGAACLGIPIGLGFYSITIITFLSMEFILLIEGILTKKNKTKEEEIEIEE